MAKKSWRRSLKTRSLVTYESVSLFFALPNSCCGTVPMVWPSPSTPSPVLLLQLDQCPGTPPPFTWLLPGHPVSLSCTWRHSQVLFTGQLLLLWGPSAPCSSHHHDVHSLYCNGLLMGLYPTLPAWELCQDGEHVLFMAESVSLWHSHHTIHLLNKWTNHCIHVPLPSLAFNRRAQRTNNTHWLHWFFLKLLHPRLKVGPHLLQFFTTVFISPCSHGFICAFAKGKCSSWAGHLVMGLPAEQSRWHQALHPLCPVEQGFLTYWWPPALLTIWYFPNAKCLLQLWKILSLTSNLTINNFFIVFSHQGLSSCWDVSQRRQCAKH